MKLNLLFETTVTCVVSLLTVAFIAGPMKSRLSLKLDL